MKFEKNMYESFHCERDARRMMCGLTHYTPGIRITRHIDEVTCDCCMHHLMEQDFALLYEEGNDMPIGVWVIQ